MKTNFLYRLLLTVLFSLFLFSDSLAGSTDRSDYWQKKVDETLLHKAFQFPDSDIEFLVFMKEQADLSESYNIVDKAGKGDYVFRTLTETAIRTQAPILSSLEVKKVDHQSFWVANMIWVRGDLNILLALASREEVARLYANSQIRIPDPDIGFVPHAEIQAAGVEWNISLLHAPAMWNAGYTGQGVVIGGQDTGYEWQHPALIEKYRGWDGLSGSHDYNWHDAIREPYVFSTGSNPCGYDSTEPCDDHRHGTHTMGTMVGDDMMGKQIGMAPGAQWIGCRNMDKGWGKPSTYIECFEWFVAPYPRSGNSLSGDAQKAPHIINNSWGCPESEGCHKEDIDLMETVVNNVRAAGILIVSSAGNSGNQGCETISTPTAIYENVFTVGATDKSDAITSFSSRGPVTIDGSWRLKPDVSAPGVGIKSSVLEGGYGYMSGTSMAAPHVAGLAALIISAKPELAGQIDALEDIIRRTAVPRTFPGVCGSFSGTEIPNPFYGWGRIDAFPALALIDDWSMLYFPVVFNTKVID
jgi:serine protease AprX